MSYIFLYVVGSLLLTYVLWIFYLAVMSLSHAKRDGTLTKTAKALGMPILFLGLFIDLLVNIFVMTFLLLELPREMTVTARLKRHNRGPDSWR